MSERFAVAAALDGAGWHPAAWRADSARPGELFTARYWSDLAQLADRAGLDFVTIEDALTVQSAAGQAQNSEQVRTAQQQLQAAGLYHGPADGQMDPDTRAAIANFQQQNGLRRTATLDQQTLNRMMTSQAAG